MSRADKIIRHGADGITATILLRRISGDARAIAVWRSLDEAVVTAAARTVTLDFRPVDYMSSSGIGELVTFAKRCHEMRVRVIICNLCPSLRHVLTLMHLDALVEIARDDLTTAASGPS